MRIVAHLCDPFRSSFCLLFFGPSISSDGSLLFEPRREDFLIGLQRPFSSSWDTSSPNWHFGPETTSILLVENLIFNFVAGAIISVAIMVIKTGQSARSLSKFPSSQKPECFNSSDTRKSGKLSFHVKTGQPEQNS